MMFTIQPLQNSGQAQRYYDAVLSKLDAAVTLGHMPAASTPLRWHGDCRGLRESVADLEFRAVCCSSDTRGAYTFVFSPSKSISQTYERLLQRHDWHHPGLILQAIEQAASGVVHELQGTLGFLVWAARTARWQRGSRHGVCWTAVVFDISPAQGEDRRKRRRHILSRTKELDSMFSEKFTEGLTNAWPEWRKATG